MPEKNLIIFFLFTLCLSGTACAGQQLTICGTGDSQELLRVLAAAYTASHPEIAIEVPDSIGSSGGIRATAQGNCDLGRVARPLHAKELKYQLNYRLFAYTPVVFVTNQSVRLRDISTEQVIALMSGKITNWRQLGGADAPLFLAIRYHGDSNRTALEENIPALKARQDWTGTITYSTPETVEAVVNHDFTLSFVPLAMAVKHQLNIFRYNGIEASADNIRSGAYKLVTPLGLVWKGELAGAAADFLEFIESVTGKQLLINNGSIPAT